jgi:AraC-like DNA-binding protein
MVCVKDVEGRYVGVNRAFVRRTRRRRAGEVIGRRAADLFPPDLAASYDAQDRALLTTGESIRNHLEVIADADDPMGGRWYVTTKVLSSTDAHGVVVVATSVDAHLGNRAEEATGLRAAIELAHDHCHEPLRVTDLAEAAGMSTDRLERAMRSTLAISPKQYVVRLRAERAATLLVTTGRTIADIAADCGYYDQSQLTRQFRRVIGVTPASYRSGARPDAVATPDPATT